MASIHWADIPEPLEEEPSSDKEPVEEIIPKLELKPLPDSLRYSFLDEEEMLPIIIAFDLSSDQEQDLLAILR